MIAAADTETQYEPHGLELFLLHHRPYCEVGLCLKPSVRIESPYKNPVAMCEGHWQGEELK